MWVFIVSSLASLSVINLEITYTSSGMRLVSCLTKIKRQKRETTIKASEEATSSKISADKWIKLVKSPIASQQHRMGEGEEVRTVVSKRKDETKRNE